MDYHRMNRVDIRIVRIFNTYGPRMHPFDGRVVSNFIRQALLGEDLTIFGDGQQTRSFCYRDDLVEGLVRLMNATDVVGPVNLGNPDEFTIQQLAELVIRAHRQPFEDHSASACRRTIRCVGVPTFRWPASISHWKPVVPLREGLEKTIAVVSLDRLRALPSADPELLTDQCVAACGLAS